MSQEFNFLSYTLILDRKAKRYLVAAYLNDDYSLTLDSSLKGSVTSEVIGYIEEASNGQSCFGRIVLNEEFLKANPRFVDFDIFREPHGDRYVPKADAAKGEDSSELFNEKCYDQSLSSLKDARKLIDDLDEEIAKTLALRRKAVEKASILKQQSGEGAVSTSREAELFSHAKALEERFNLPKSLMVDIARRMLRSSYNDVNEERSHLHIAESSPLPKVQSKVTKVVIVGGNGGMGRFFIKYLERAHYEVSVVEPQDYTLDVDGLPLAKDALIDKSLAAKRIKEAQWVIVSVPIEFTIDVIKTVSSLMSKDAILSDLTSTKTESMRTMNECHAGPVLGLHPMFGPSTSSMIKQVVVSIKGNNTEGTEFINEQLKLFGANVVECTAAEHDHAMRVIQALRHFTTIAYGVFLKSLVKDTRDVQDSAGACGANARCTSAGGAGAGSDDDVCGLADNAGESLIKKLLELSSPIYRLELIMVGRLFAQSAHLYTDIISSSPKNLELIESYIKTADECYQMLKHKDREGFINEFNKTTAFFGEYAKIFLKDSSNILDMTQDMK